MKSSLYRLLVYVALLLFVSDFASAATMEQIAAHEKFANAASVLGENVTVSQAATVPVVITSPKGGDQINLGSTVDIKWTAPGYTGKFDLIIYGGLLTNDYVAGYIAKDVPNTGSYSWNMTASMDPLTEYYTSKIVPGNNYTIQILSNEQPAYYETDPFSIIRPGVGIPTVDLKVNGKTVPDRVEESAKVTVSWVGENVSSCDGSGDDLPQYNNPTSTSWGKLTGLSTSGSMDIIAKDPAYNYSVLYVGIVCKNSYGDEVSNIVYLPVHTVTAPAPSIVMIKPGGGESYKLGESIPILWNTNNYTGTITITLEGSLGSQFYYIAKDVANTGSFNFNTTSQLLAYDGKYSLVQPGQYSIYVTTTSYSAYDNSAPFTIVDQPISVVNNKPKGYVDGLTDQGNIAGWAFDPDHLYTSITVHTYFDAPAGAGRTPLVNNTDFARPDVNALFGQKGVHGFNIPVPPNFRDGKTHTAYIYAIDGTDTTGAHNVLIQRSPFSFKLTPVRYKPVVVTDGQLFNDNGTIYVIENQVKRAFVSMSVFNGLGYNLDNAIAADTSNITKGMDMSSLNVRHPRGAVVNINGTIFFMGSSVRYAFPSAEIFFSWGLKFSDVLKANTYDMNVPFGPTVTPPSGNLTEMSNRDAIRISGVQQIVTALELFYNDNGRYPTSTSGQPTALDGSPSWSTYISSYPIAPTPADGTCYATVNNYSYQRVSTSYYTLTFCLGGAFGGFSAGVHVASPAGIN